MCEADSSVWSKKQKSIFNSVLPTRIFILVQRMNARNEGMDEERKEEMTEGRTTERTIASLLARMLACLLACLTD